MSLDDKRRSLEEQDPTRIDIEFDDWFDPTKRIMSGVAIHQNMPFSCTLISQITDNLWVGGCENGLQLPPFINRVVSLYPWERYELHDGVTSRDEIRLYDSNDMPDESQLFEIADQISEYIEAGDTVLIHCQAGLNRSNLIAVLVLMNEGMTARAAIDLLREKRSPAVLCNQTFERWLLSLDKDPFA